MKILFLHGWHSTPGGRKPTYLANQGHQVCNPSLCPDDFQKALQAAQQAYDEFGPQVIVGSSRGGAVAMNIRSAQTPLVLMCPAWKHWGDVKRLMKPAILIHSSQDEVVDYEDSVELVKKSGLDARCLWTVGKDHRLADEEALEALQKACFALVSPD